MGENLNFGVFLHIFPISLHPFIKIKSSRKLHVWVTSGSPYIVGVRSLFLRLGHFSACLGVFSHYVSSVAVI